MNNKTQPLFVERRKGNDRRQEPDRCAGLTIDLYHRKRRRKNDRRTHGRTLTEDIVAFYQAQEATSADPVH